MKQCRRIKVHQLLCCPKQTKHVENGRLFCVTQCIYGLRPCGICSGYIGAILGEHITGVQCRIKVMSQEHIWYRFYRGVNVKCTMWLTRSRYLPLHGWMKTPILHDMSCRMWLRSINIQEWDIEERHKTWLTILRERRSEWQRETDKQYIDPWNRSQLPTLSRNDETETQTLTQTTKSWFGPFTSRALLVAENS